MNESELAHWLARRAGQLTASKMLAAMSFKKDGTSTAQRADLIRETLAERLTGESVRHYVSPAMLHGIEYEEEARREYEADTGNLVARPIPDLMPYQHPAIEFLAASHDGFVGHDGMVEIKCPTTSTHINWVLAGAVPEEYRPQMVVELECCRRAWCDFVSYDPRIRDEKRRLFVRRYTPTDEERAKVLDAARKFLAEVDAMFEAFTGAA
jgi:exodeoxyribonuclease (lambda-induced)